MRFYKERNIALLPKHVKRISLAFFEKGRAAIRVRSESLFAAQREFTKVYFSNVAPIKSRNTSGTMIVPSSVW